MLSRSISLASRKSLTHPEPGRNQQCWAAYTRPGPKGSGSREEVCVCVKRWGVSSERAMEVGGGWSVDGGVRDEGGGAHAVNREGRA